MSSKHQVIFDTDIGTDVDDILALGFLLGSPDEIDLIGITTVYGDVALRARMALKMLQLRGRTDVEVHTGITDPLMKLDPIYWPGHEGVGLLQPDDVLPEPTSSDAVGYLIDTVLANPGQITLLAVGPLTNVATAILREPRFVSSLKQLMIMGGKVNMSGHSWGPGEHNIKCDPEAAAVVFNSGAIIDLVPLDVTLRALIRQDGVDALKAAGDPYHDALGDQVARYPGFVARGGSTFLHDPLAAMALVSPELLGWEPYHVQVELAGRFTRAMTVVHTAGPEFPTTARIAMTLDVDACETLIAKRLAS
jgi:purine nucleosidase